MHAKTKAEHASPQSTQQLRSMQLSIEISFATFGNCMRNHNAEQAAPKGMQHLRDLAKSVLWVKFRNCFDFDIGIGDTYS